ncbi:MAG: transcription termination factor NusA [Treponema sp.]|nr:transcription termination factor NusA [Treponema sp.]
MSEMAEAIRALMDEKGCSEDSVKQTIEKALKAAYKRTFGTDENAIVTFEDDLSEVHIYSRKTVLDGVYDPVIEIELEEAKELSDDLEEGDEIDIELDPKTFERSAVSTGKQTAHQGLTEKMKDSLMSEYKDKVGQTIIGYCQRERNGTIYVDLGSKVEGVLPAKYQSKLEHYDVKDRIKSVIAEVKTSANGVQLILSRTDKRLVQNMLETEVPELADGTVEIRKIERDAGYRTKIAVSTNREEIDPVGACVGQKGQRIQTVIRELENEKIDVLRYETDPVLFIKNALSPAQVERVVILDQDKRQALAIVEESQFSLAIGRQGQNVRLANKLCDWNIDVKTIEQAAEMDLSDIATVQNAENLFDSSYDEIETIQDLPGVDERVAALLKENGIEDIQRFVEAFDNDEIHIDGVTADDLEAVNDLIEANVQFVEETEPAQTEAPAETAAEAEEEEYFCPECGAKITLDMTHCPNCGIEFEFEEE